MMEPIKRNAHAYGTRVMGEDDDEDIDMNKREELQYRAARYDNRNEEEEEESYANSKTNVSNSSATNSSTDNPSVQQLMDQMAIIQRQLAKMQAQLPLKLPAIQDTAQASPSTNTPAEQVNNKEIIKTSNKEATTADPASEPPTSTQGKAAEATKDSKQKSKSIASEVVSGHQNG